MPTRIWNALVHTLEGRDGRALLLVESRANNTAVREIDLAVGGLLPGQSVLHPVLVITVGVVLAGVGATRLLAVSSGGGGLGAINQSLSTSISSLLCNSLIRSKLTRK